MKNDIIYSNKRSKQHEARLAKELQAKQTKASGATAHDKGDLKSDDILYELKLCSKDSYKLKFKELKKVIDEADNHPEGKKLPVFVVTFETLKMFHNDADFVIMRKDDFVKHFLAKDRS